MPADWSVTPQDQSSIVISTWSPECLGVGLSGVVPAFAFSSHTWAANNLAIFIPFVVSTSITVVKMGLYNGATASGNVDIGVYDDQQNQLIENGSVAQTGINSVQVFDTTDTTLDPGQYYLGLALSSTAGTVFSYTNLTGARSFGILQQTTAFPLPSPASFATNTTNTLTPMVMLTAKTVV